MKTRTSHVSNSSSCSFIFIGFDVSDLAINGDLAYEKGYQYINDPEMGAPDENTNLLGFTIKSWEDTDPLETMVIDINELKKKYDLAKLRSEFGIPGDIDAKIYIGTSVC
jgi:hypothetical protein